MMIAFVFIRKEDFEHATEQLPGRFTRFEGARRRVLGGRNGKPVARAHGH